MTSPARERALEGQRRASDPAVSAFVSASAGSGKTKLLTDRLLRLMLTGTDPGRIQCLTFTKAAAAEMAVRLQAVLGRWVTVPDETLDRELAELAIELTPEMRAAARALFARVLDLPGGMRIGTIHAFCQSLLRRFPLEARLSPHFGLLEDADAAATLAAAQEDVLARAHDVATRQDLQTLAGLVSFSEFGALVAQLKNGHLWRLFSDYLALDRTMVEASLRRVLGATADEVALMAEAAAWPEETKVREAASLIAKFGSQTVADRALRILDWLDLDRATRQERWQDWCNEFLCDNRTPRRMGALINSRLAAAYPHLAEILAAEQARVQAIENMRAAARTASLSAALVTLAAPVVQAFTARKNSAGLLDFDDLIARTSALLADPGAAWVLYKLDGGIDHLLLDEVQDTSPAQWAIAGALTEEFFAGVGARSGTQRTVFAVGDRKQSIYSFQGADPDGFETWRERLGRRVRDAGNVFADVTLDVSFRSTVPVLDLVDAVFAAPEAAAGVCEPGSLRHLADRAGHAGSVELWPLAPSPQMDVPDGWHVPDANLHAPSAVQRLADALAVWIKRETSGEVMLESRGRPLAPGDVLILVRRRNEFAHALTRALKRQGVPVAGLDRMMLTEQPAVSDLLALADTLLLPQDDLSLACVLTSPIGGLSDDSLMELAAYRPDSQTLWDTLRIRAHERQEWNDAWTFLHDLFARVDYATPHALFVEALGRQGGRAKLLARLGHEAAEPIDELLNAALVYGAQHPPSLQGFVHWLRASGAEVKRQAESMGERVRLMTVHGAKGLQAPLVILPDTTSLPQEHDRLVWCRDGQATLPVWVPRKEFGCPASQRLADDAKRRRMEEHNRLLYVALTRAEDRLLVCGWQPQREPPAGCWYQLVKQGFDALRAPAVPLALPWADSGRRHAVPQTRPPDIVARAALPQAAVTLPAWAGRAPDWRCAPPQPEPVPPVPLAPSRPQHAELGSVPETASPLTARDATGARFRRGRLVHALLQHLPALPQEKWAEAAERFLARRGHGLDLAEVKAITADVLAVLTHPSLAPLFGPLGRAEVPLSGVIGGRVVGGLVDRLAVLPDCVLLADYKTNRAKPQRVEDVPVLYLRQMAAYRAVLRAIYPDRPVICALVWTIGADVTELPGPVLDSHSPAVEPAA